MDKYLVELYKKNIMAVGSKPHGPYNFNLDAASMEEAALQASNEIGRIGLMSADNDAWNATVFGPKKEKYEILRNGAWLIDLKTGKNISELEEKILS